ncbi:MAG TPA: FAD-dependent oxidoreductase [Terriglobales bacterium]|nr:FAD-dependent oxidoreductase [Terriglobales bacterium]
MNSRKKHLGKLLALCLAVMLAVSACAPAAAPGPEPAGISYTPGTYTATTMGNNGPLTVSMTFTKGAIERITVDESVETLGLGAAAIDKLSALITGNQSLDVDLVSGATYSSGAFLSVVTDCVEQAGGDVSALKAVPLQLPPATKEELSADLVIVGAGSAGMTAACRAAQAGLDVIVLEKMAFAGGASMIAGGGMVLSGSQYQKDKGVTDDSPESMMEDFRKNGNSKNDPLLLRLYAENVGSTVDWAMEKMNLKFVDEELSYAPEYSYNRLANILGGASGYGETLRNALASSGAKLMLETRADELIVENGAVTGVKATASNGSTYTIRAKSTLLATGGYGNAPEMLQGGLETVLYYGPMSSTGDGQKMAQSVNAKFQLLEYGKMYPNGVEVAKRIGKSTIYGNYAAFNLSGILVNKGGERVVNERASNHTVLVAQLASQDKELFLVMDAASYEAFKSQLYKHSITQQDLDRWIGNAGKTAPVHVTAATIEEAATLAGIDPAALAATVERYNGFVKNGEDQDFGRLPDFLKSEIGAGPYYIIEQKPRFATTMGSVVTTESLQILDENEQPIPNLYAAGEMVNGVHGEDSPSGANLGWALTSGRLAADAIIAAQK